MALTNPVELSQQAQLQDCDICAHRVTCHNLSDKCFKVQIFCIHVQTLTEELGTQTLHLYIYEKRAIKM